MGDRFEEFRRGGAVSKQVHHGEATKPPLLREADATPQGGIILAMVGPTRVEHNESDRWTADRPLPPQPIAILTSLVEFSGSLNVDSLTQNAVYPVIAQAFIVGLKPTAVILRRRYHRCHDGVPNC